MTHDEFIAALEAAEEPSRELDAEIYCWLEMKAGHSASVVAGAGAITYSCCSNIWFAAPRYTASIDASETLRLPGWVISVHQREETSIYQCSVASPPNPTGNNWVITARHKLEPIARTIAWLKARQHV